MFIPNNTNVTKQGMIKPYNYPVGMVCLPSQFQSIAHKDY